MKTQVDFEVEKRAKLQAYAFIASMGLLGDFKRFCEAYRGTTAEEYHAFVLSVLENNTNVL